MSRVGKNPIAIPQGVKIAINENKVTVEGKNGKQEYNVPAAVSVVEKDNSLIVTLNNPELRSLWGTTQRNIKNMVIGVSEGFRVNLDLVGVGYRAAVQGNNLVLQLGYSHEIVYPVPQGIEIKCEKPTSIAIFGANKQRVGEVATDIAAKRPPEPYKGKGVLREGKFVYRKEGKKK